MYYPSLFAALAALVYALHCTRRRERPLIPLSIPRDLRVQLDVTLTEQHRPQCSPCEKPEQTLPAENAEVEPDDEPDTTRILVDSLTLLTCYRYLFGEFSTQRVRTYGGDSGFREVFHYLSGLRVDEHTYVISHLLPVRFSQQHAGGVRVSQPSNIDLLTKLDALELPLVAHCHSHPGSYGAESTVPSTTDHRFQASLEKGRCHAIGLIFARSTGQEAYVRFFGGEQTRFKVEVQGAHVEQVEDHVFRLSLENDQLPVATIVAQ